MFTRIALLKSPGLRYSNIGRVEETEAWLENIRVGQGSKDMCTEHVEVL